MTRGSRVGCLASDAGGTPATTAVTSAQLPRLRRPRYGRSYF